MTKEDFHDWKRHPVTQTIFSYLNSLIAEGKTELAATAGVEPILDSRKAGKISAFQDILDMTFEESVEND